MACLVTFTTEVCLLFIFPFWEKSHTNLTIHVESHLMVLMMLKLPMVHNLTWDNLSFPGLPPVQEVWHTLNFRTEPPAAQILQNNSGNGPEHRCNETEMGSPQSPRNTLAHCFPFKCNFSNCLSYQHPAMCQAPLPTRWKWGYWDKDSPLRIWISYFPLRVGKEKVPSHK